MVSTKNDSKTDGIWGSTNAPDHCPECDREWSHGERVWTGDEAGIGGYEDWMYCNVCNYDLFYPVVHLPVRLSSP